MPATSESERSSVLTTPVVAVLLKPSGLPKIEWNRIRIIHIQKIQNIEERIDRLYVCAYTYQDLIPGNI